MLNHQIQQHLFSLQDLKYQQFIAKLIPNETQIIGVRQPLLVQFAHQLTQQYPASTLLNYLETEVHYHEEIILQGLLLSLLSKDLLSLQHHTRKFIPKIRNWAICDSFCKSLKLTNQYQEQQWQFILPYFSVNEPYAIRFACIMALTYFVQENYLDQVLQQLNQLTFDDNQDYYVKMAVAWVLSTCFIKFPDKTLNYLTSNTNLDKFTYNKTCQKIIESLQVPQNLKKSVKQLRKK